MSASIPAPAARSLTDRAAAARPATGWRARFLSWLALDDDYVRPMPTPAQRRGDVYLALAFAAVMVVTIETVRSLGVLDDTTRPLWQIYALSLVGVVPLAWRRRFPLTVTVLTQLHFFVLGVTVPGIMRQLVVQVLCFFGLFSGVAWGRDRRAVLVVAMADIVFMFGWVAYDFSVGNAFAEIGGQVNGQPGLLPPIVAWVIFSAMLNAVFFFGACWWGQSSWRAARNSHRLVEQAETIAAQADHRQERAVVEERLRIARELHDVVAHHVSVIGVQAGAARRVLTKRPEAASEALLNVEQSSRTAVTEMRALLGTLRTSQESHEQASSRGPGPGVGAIPELVESFRGPGLRVDYAVVDEPAGSIDAVSGPVSLSLYRIVQESLSNVRAHSSARSARVVLRVSGTDFVEAEIVDDGRPLGATGGSGVGLIGMRERVASHRGKIEVGPRLQGGYRVRVRFPLDAGRAAPAGDTPSAERGPT